MPESVESFMERKHDPKWAVRLRLALGKCMPKGIRLPGEPKRDKRGRFTR